jgi:hypothetical protein
MLKDVCHISLLYVVHDLLEGNTSFLSKRLILFRTPSKVFHECLSLHKDFRGLRRFRGPFLLQAISRTNPGQTRDKPHPRRHCLQVAHIILRLAGHLIPVDIMTGRSRIILMTKEDIINLIRSSLPTLRREYGVKRIGVFGSAVSGHLSDKSDIDLVVEFERPIGFRFLDLAEDLEELLGRKVDILTPDGMNSIRVPSVAENIRENTVYV